MRDLTAQVTSGLLQFPEVTIQALGEDEITLESVLRGRFASGKNGLACLACGPQLEVVNSVTGERLSAYRFSGVNEQTPIVLAVKEFSWQKRTGLLIGLEESEGSVLCLYDLGISRVVKAVVLPGRVTAIEPIINHGGASASTQHLHPSLRWLFGVAAVVTDVGQILLIDLCLDDLSCSQNEVEASDLEVITGVPAEVPHVRESVMREGRHLCFQLVSPSGTAVSTLSYISRTNQLAVGFSDGYLALWNMKSMKREYYTQLEGGRVPVYAVTFQEPENDPRNCCYLWAVQSTQDSEGDVLSLHLLQLAFGDRKCLASGQILYEGLEYCEERYTLDLTGGMFPLRGEASNTKLLGCQSIEKFRSHGDREESMSEDDAVQLSRLCYNYPVIQNYYTNRRQKCERLSRGKWNPDCLMIDGMVSQLGDRVEKLWKRDEGGTGKYPPTSLHSGLDLLFHPATAKPVPWQHSKIIQAFMSQGEHRQALRYIQTMKPTVSSGSDVILHLTVLLFNRCMVEAWSLLRQHSNRLNIEELLKHTYEVCQEMGLMEDLLKLPFTETEQNDRDPHLRERSVARNSILDQYGKILPRVQRKLAIERTKPYHLSTSSIFREVSRPKPLSAVPKQAVTGTILTRSVFINNVLSKIGEVWASKEPKHTVSPYKSLKIEEPSAIVYSLPDPEVPEAFVGTPISKASQKISRSGLRTTPLASPSLSPGRSLTPPLRLKETRISFMEEDMNTWAAGATDDNKIKVFVSTPFLKCGVSAETEWRKNKDKTTSFCLNSPEKDYQEMDVTSQDTSQPTLDKLDVSKENSSASARSDQTSLEYQDAPLPEDFEDTVLIASEPASSSTQVITNLTEQTEKEEVKESEVTPRGLEKQLGTVEDSAAKDLIVTEEAFSELSRSQGVEASLCVPSVQEGKILTLKSKVPVLDEVLVSVEACTSTIRADNNKPVASVLGDSGSSGLTTSESPIICEHRLDQEIALNVKEDHEVEVDVLKESVDLPEEKPPITDSPPDTQEIHVTGREKLETQDSGEQARNISFNELYPSGTLKLQYNFDTIEQQFCDLPDNKDSAECDIAEVDGELFVAQSNFTLILEGEEGEIETGDSAPSNVLPKVANTTTEEKLVYIRENGDHGHVANLPSIITSDQESKKVETLPYVPEPIKVAIAENLLDVIKDTRSKEITADAMEQSINENIPLISQKVISSTNLVKSPFKTIQETNTVTINVSQVDDTVSSRTRTRGQRIQNLNIKSAQQEKSEDVATPKTPRLSAMKKTRKTKETSEASESAYSDKKGVSQNQQIPQNSITPRRGRRRKEINQDTLESIDSVEQEPQASTGKKLKMLKSSQLLEPATEETSFRKEVKLSSATKRTPKRMKKPVENQESVEIVNNLKVIKEVSPSRGIRKLRSTNLEASENIQQKDEKSGDQPLPIQRSRRVREREISTRDVVEDPKLDSSQLPLQAEFDMPATPRKRGRPRKINPSEVVGSKPIKEETCLKTEVLSIQRRSTRNTPAKSENVDVGKPVLEKFVLVPNEELDVVMSSKKKLTKKTENQSQKRSLRSISEEHIDEMTHEGPHGHEERLLATTASGKSSRSTRTRSSKAILSDFSEPKNEPLLSPPASKVSRKVKAEKIETPAQLKELVSDLSSQFISSPPALRTRRKKISSASQHIDELEDDAKSLETVEKQKVKRMRTEKAKQASKNTEKASSWSPPPVEIKLLSPLASPIDDVKSKPRKTAERDVFLDLGRGILDSAWQGYNATLLAYGQTGSGKSYSMIGCGANKGIIPKVCEKLFQATANQEKNREYQIRDLLSRTRKKGGLKVREDQQLGFYVEDLKSVPCENYAQIERLMEQGTKIRTTASTNMNASSSRSHMVITIQFKQVFLDRDFTKQSSINLVDLAGSERQKSSGSEGDRLREGSRVNLSLTNLGNVIRAKKIRNKAVVNTWRLMSESRAENYELLVRCGNSRMAEQPACFLPEHQLGAHANQATWAHLLEQAQKEWEQQYVAMAQERQMMKTLPHLLNVNEDPQLTGVLKFFIQAGERFSTSSGTSAEPRAPPQDRLILGSNSAYLYIGLPSERGGSEDWGRFDYHFFQLERAAAEGVSVDKLGSNGDGKADPSVLAAFQDYIKLMPLVAEANQMSEELKKVWIWSKAKFINRKFLMEELYQRVLDGEESHVAQEDDPFWDPVEAVFLGSAHIWLQSLAYCMKFEEQVEFLNCDGLEEAVLHIRVAPCSPAGRVRSEEDVVIDPLELLGKRIDFQIRIVRCLGVKWLKEDAKRGIQIGYRIYDLPHALYTRPVWKIMNPQIEETTQFAALNASQEFLNYLQTNALIVDLWGLQEGCAELSCPQLDFMVTGEGHIMVDTKKISTVKDTSQTTSNQMSELYLKLLMLEQETELLRNVNRALRKENVFLKESIEKIGSGHQGGIQVAFMEQLPY
ncbi:Protein ELYS [Tupaia chinensis]|uniref:Protein ELYS n=1 Tax=Tupaia chinensis TaxID=246437 RepID=L9JGX3_TUPCH|nr:Protein ELYS [Tupaia chinensis]